MNKLSPQRQSDPSDKLRGIFTVTLNLFQGLHMDADPDESGRYDDP